MIDDYEYGEVGMRIALGENLSQYHFVHHKYHII
jgi:hypothetical protein